MYYFEALLVSALRGAVKPTAEDYLKKVFRWNSKTFATPLHQVGDLPLDDVLGAYFEEQFADMGQEELEAEIRLVTEDADEREARERADISKNMDDEKFLEMSKKAAAQRKIVKKMEERPAIPALPAPATIERPPPTHGIEEPLEPNIDISFVEQTDEKEFEALLEGGFANRTR